LAALPDIRKIPLEHLMCREQNHDMQYYIPLDKTKLRAPWGVRVRKRCTRCGAERPMIIDSTGAISVSTYDYSDAVTYEDAKHFTRTECRAEIARRIKAGKVELRS
jgi:hypothetical protein